MVTRKNSKEARKKIRARIRAKISGTAQRPRLAVFRSANHIYAQLIDDTAGVTLAAASSLEKGFEGSGGNKEGAHKVGLAIAERAKAENRKASFQMVTDDVYAIGKGRLVGRPRY